MAYILQIALFAMIIGLNMAMSMFPLQQQFPTFMRQLENDKEKLEERQHPLDQFMIRNELIDQAKPGDPCCFPSKWQGKMFRYFSAAAIETEFNFYEDSTKGQFAAYVQQRPDGSTTERNETTAAAAAWLIVKFNAARKTATLYQFNNVSKVCEKRQLQNITYDQATVRCVSKSSTFLGAFSLGIPGGGTGSSFQLRSWTWKPLPDTAPNLTLERLVSRDCAPVLDIVRGTVGGSTPFLQSDYYFNIQTRITDPRVFNVPSYCQKSAEDVDDHQQVKESSEVSAKSSSEDNKIEGEERNVGNEDFHRLNMNINFA